MAQVLRSHLKEPLVYCVRGNQYFVVTRKTPLPTWIVEHAIVEDASAIEAACILPIEAEASFTVNIQVLTVDSLSWSLVRGSLSQIMFVSNYVSAVVLNMFQRVQSILQVLT